MFLGTGLGNLKASECIWSFCISDAADLRKIIDVVPCNRQLKAICFLPIADISSEYIWHAGQLFTPTASFGGEGCLMTVQGSYRNFNLRSW